MAGAHAHFLRPRKSSIVLPLFIMAIAYWLSSMPVDTALSEPSCALIPVLNNALHVPAYALLTISWHWSLRAWTQTSFVPIFACLIAATYGIFSEWHQSFVPGRFASLIDVVLNGVGVALGIGFVLVFKRTRTKVME
jgi:VanZ family protein